MSDLRVQFGQRLRALRIERGMTQEDLAKVTGFSTAFISQMERGINAPSFESLEMLAKALDKDVMELFDFRGAKSSEKSRMQQRSE
jgi:transcriptional regulator with XRE-family HTH domain